MLEELKRTSNNMKRSIEHVFNMWMDMDARLDANIAKVESRRTVLVDFQTATNPPATGLTTNDLPHFENAEDTEHAD